MKVFGLVLGLCLITSLAFADAEGEIVAKDKDINGNIRIWTQYKIDGVEVESRYPKIDGKQVYCTRYSRQNFIDMTKNEITEHIDNDIKTHADNLIQKEYDKKAPTTVRELKIEYNAEENQKFIDASFPDIIARKITSDNAKVVIGDEEYTFKSDGTHTVKPVSIE